MACQRRADRWANEMGERARANANSRVIIGEEARLWRGMPEKWANAVTHRAFSAGAEMEDQRTACG